MTNKHQGKSQKNKKNLPTQNTPSVSAPVNDIIKDNPDTEKESDSKNTHCKRPQPFVVKIDSNKKWKRAEIISAISVGLTFIAIFMAIKSFNKTRDAVALSDSTYKRMILRDSITNQPYLQISDVSFIQISKGQELAIKYTLRNYGQLPAIVFNQVGNVMYAYQWIDSIKKNPLCVFKETDTLIPQPLIISKENIESSIIAIPHLEPPQIKALTAGLMDCYFYGRYQYKSPVYISPHEYKYVIQLAFYKDFSGEWKTKYIFLYNETNVVE